MTISYNTKIITNGLVLLHDGSNIKSYVGSGSTVNDLSGNNNAGTFASGASYSSPAFVLSVANNSINTNSSSSLTFTNSTFTISTWIKLNTTPSTSSAYNVISKKYSYNNTRQGWMCYYDFRTPGILQLRMNNGATLNDDTPTATVNNSSILNQTTNYVNAVWASSNGTVNFYLNGKFNSSSTYTQVATNNALTLQVGQASGLQEIIINMNVGAYLIYNRLLTAEEVAINFAAYRKRYGI